MKKIISFMCVVAILCTMLISVKPLDVSAAYGTWLDDWTNTGGHKIIDHSTIQIPNGARLSHTYVWRPKKYAIEFSVAVLTSSNSIGIQGETGFVRPGGYIRDGHFMSMVGGIQVETPNSWDGNHHTYRLEIDHGTNIQKIYYDGSYAGEWELPVQDSSYYTSDNFFFWALNGGAIEITNVSFTSLSDGYEFPTDYTEAYFEDYTYSEDEYLAGTTSCRVPEGKWSQYFSCDAENGTVSIYREKVRSTETYIEHPLKATTNFDLEYRLKQTKVNENVNQAGFVIRVATDDRYTWLSFGGLGIDFKSYSEYYEDTSYEAPVNDIIYELGYDWVQIKGEFRDRWVTWYVKRDGETEKDDEYKELMRYKVMTNPTGMWTSAVGMNYALANYSGGFTMDWQRYTPYDDSFAITSPAANAEFTEGENITFDVNLTAGASYNIFHENYSKKVDYYINGFSVGQGKYSGGFAYTFSGAKPGVYRLTAECSDGKTSAETIFTVKRAENDIAITQKNTDDLGLAFVGKADDTWYTYKIVVGDFDGGKSFVNDHDEIVKVYQKERGAADSEYQKLTGIPAPYGADLMYGSEDLEGADYLYGATFTTKEDILHLGYYNARLRDSNKINTEYSVDNLQFATDDIAYSGYVTDTDAEIFVDTAEEIEAVVLASYDENDVLVDIDFAELNGGTNFADLNIKAGSSTKLYLWNSVTAGKPLLASPIEIE